MPALIGPAASTQPNTQATMQVPMAMQVMPVVTGFTLQLDDTAGIVVFTSGTTLTATIILPINPFDEQQIRLGSQRSITALTMVAGQTGHLMVNNPTALTGGTGCTMIFNQSDNTWYRIA
jgi:hypothetical protein